VIEAADVDGGNVRAFAAFDQGGEEMRCVVPPNKLWPDAVYCHTTPDNRVVRMNRDGSHLTQLAKLPAGSNSDGAIAFDDVGRFGYPLLVATGGSGSDGGEVFAVRKDGRVQTIGSYPRSRRRREHRRRSGQVRHRGRAGACSRSTRTRCRGPCSRSTAKAT